MTSPPALHLRCQDGAPSPQPAGRSWQLRYELPHPVTLTPAYWLCHSHGFLVDDETGRAVGVVEDVLSDGETGRVRALDVRSGWNGRRRLAVPVDAVVEIAPAERRLLVSGRRPAPPRRPGAPPPSG